VRYQIIETQPFKLFGMDAVQIDDWDSEKFLEHADRVIENGSHDATNIAAGFPGNAREMITKGEWDLSKINLLHAVHFWDEAGKKYFMYGWEVPETGVGEQFKIIEVPLTTWVILTIPLDGERSAIVKCYNDLYMNWFPTSGYEQAPGRPVIEKYDNKKAELWMPIIKKQ
jgi:predicted transcriptional regulator YdeE